MIQVKSYSIGHEYPTQCVMYNTKFYSKTCVCVSQSSAQPGDNQLYYNNFVRYLCYKTIAILWV